MPNAGSAPRGSNRIEIILGKSRIEDNNYYLVKLKNKSIFDAIWMTTLEACHKGLTKIKEFNKSKIITLKNNCHFINEEILQNQLSDHYFYLRTGKNAHLKSLEAFDDELDRQIKTSLQYLKIKFQEELKQKDLLNSNKQITKHQNKQDQQYQNYTRPQFQIDFSSLKQLENVKTFIGRITIKGHYLYLVKRKQQKLVNIKWYYLQGLVSKVKCTDKLQRFNNQCKQINIFDKDFLIKQLKESQSYLSKEESDTLQTIYKTEENIKLELQQSENQIIEDFMKKKVEDLNNIIKNQKIKLRIIEIIGKTTINKRCVYLVKAADDNNEMHFKWKFMKIDEQRAEKTMLLKKFNADWGHYPLPFFKPKYRNIKNHFENSLKQVSFLMIDKIFAKVVSASGVFYLAKFQNKSIFESQWTSSYAYLNNLSYSYKKVKQFNETITSQIGQICIDKEIVLIEIFKSWKKISQTKLGLKPDESLVNFEVDKIYKSFVKEAQDIQQLFSNEQYIRDLIKSKQKIQMKTEKIQPKFEQEFTQMSEEYQESKAMIKKEQSKTKKEQKSMKRVKKEENEKNQKGEKQNKTKKLKIEAKQNLYFSSSDSEEESLYFSDESESSEQESNQIKLQEI